MKIDKENMTYENIEVSQKGEKIIISYLNSKKEIMFRYYFKSDNGQYIVYKKEIRNKKGDIITYNEDTVTVNRIVNLSILE